MDEENVNIGMTPRGPLLNDNESAGLSIAVGRSFMALKDAEAQISDLHGQLMSARALLNAKTEENKDLQEKLDAALAELEQLRPAHPDDHV